MGTPEEAKTRAAATWNSAPVTCDLGLPPGDFDAVVCAFGIFFVPDVEAAIRELWETVRSLFSSVGVQESTVVAESGSQPLAAPEDWWPMVLGTGYRGTIEQLDGESRARVREDCLRFIRAADVRAVEVNVVYAVGLSRRRGA